MPAAKVLGKSLCEIFPRFQSFSGQDCRQNICGHERNSWFKFTAFISVDPWKQRSKDAFNLLPSTFKLGTAERISRSKFSVCCCDGDFMLGPLEKTNPGDALCSSIMKRGLYRTSCPGNHCIKTGPWANSWAESLVKCDKVSFITRWIIAHGSFRMLAHS